MTEPEPETAGRGHAIGALVDVDSGFAPRPGA